MSLVIKKADIDDIPALCALERECFSCPWSADAFLSGMREQTSIFVKAELDTLTVGYAGGVCVLDECSVTNVAVTGGYRKKGIGTALVRALEAEAAKLGAAVMFLEVRVSNASAISVYEGLGYERCGVRKGFYSKPREDAYVFKKELAK